MLGFKFVDIFEVNNFELTFFSMSYSSTGKWNSDIDFFRVLMYCTIIFLILVYSKNFIRMISETNIVFFCFFKKRLSKTFSSLINCFEIASK